MSFSRDIKEELSRQIPSARHCRLSEIAAILSFCDNAGTGEHGTKYTELHTENPAVARKYFTLLRKTFNINVSVSVRRNMGAHRTYIYKVASDHDLSAARNMLIQNQCCKRAYIRGAFLAAGSLSDPRKSYHFEIVCGSIEQAEKLRTMFEDFDIDAKLVTRKKNIILYVKEGSQISDVLNVMEAHVSLMKFENIRILKDMRNSVNRQVNCETANLNKTVSAAVKQIEDIHYIEKTIGFAKLPGSLAEIARLRLEQPGLTLKELGEMLNPPVGKSGVNHRLRRLSAIADELRGS